MGEAERMRVRRESHGIGEVKDRQCQRVVLRLGSSTLPEADQALGAASDACGFWKS